MAATYDWSEYVTTKQQQEEQGTTIAEERPQRRSSLLDAGIDFIMGSPDSSSTNRTGGTTMYGGSIVRGLENDNDDVHPGGSRGGGGTNHKYDENDSYFTDDDEYGVGGGDGRTNNEMVGVVNVVSTGGRNGGGGGGVRRGGGNGGYGNGRRPTSNNSNCVSVLKRIRWKRVCCACSVLVGFILLIVAMVTAVTNKAQIDTVNTLLDETTDAVVEAAVAATGMTTGTDEEQDGGEDIVTSTTSDFEEEQEALLDVQDKSASTIPSNLYTNDMVDHIKNLASSISGDRAFLSQTAPHKAMEWFLVSDANAQFILDQKLLDMNTSDVTATAKLYQRYVVVTILFGLLGDDSNNNIDTYVNPSTFVCQWNGVTCNDEGYVTHLSLDGQNLKGTLVEEIGYLPQLIWLDVSENHLQGILPSTMDQLTKLEHLYIEENNGGLTLGKSQDNNSNPAVCTLRDNYKLIHFEMDCPEENESDSNSNTLENKCICCTKCYDPSSESSTYSSAVNYITSFFTGSSSSNTESDETSSSTNVDELIRQTIESLYTSDSSGEDSSVSILHQDSNNSPQHEAYMWIMYEDTYFENSIKSTLLTDELRTLIVERYVLALLYFQMISNNDDDTINWIYDGSTLETCQWENVECHSSGSRITHLKLGGKQLSSNIPYEMMYLNKLQHLDLANNHITGKLPVDAISKLSQLELLNLQENEFDQDALTSSSSSASGICSLRYQNLKHFVVDCNVDCTCCTSCGKQ